jgi:tetratricopeptide (TPR) repeat protein
MEDPRMKIRHGLVLTFAMAFGLSACAGGGATSGTTASGPAVPGGEVIRQGERPRQSDETRAAQRALEEADETADDAQAEALYQQALASAEAAIAADSTNPLAHRLAAMASMGLDDYEAADAYMSRAEELRPIYTLETEGIREQAWISLYQRAAPLVNSGDYEEAAEIFEMANHIYDQRPEVMLTLGQIYAQLRRHDDALQNLDRAMAIIRSDKAQEMDSTTVAGWYEQAESVPLLRASVLADAGRFEEAADAYRGLVAENPTDVGLARNLAGILVQLGNNEEAFQVYDDLMTRPGLTSADYYNIGVGFYQGSDYTRAARAFGEAAGQSVNDRDAIEMWARSLQLDSAYAEIPPVAERWVELDPNNRNGHLILAQAVNLEGDDERTSQIIRRIEALEVTVSDLQITRLRDGGAQVNGTLMNNTLDQGTSVTMTFTFYDEAGTALGTTDHTVSVGAAEMTVPFTVEFASSGPVAGYGYTVSVS